MLLVDEKERELERFKVPYGAIIQVANKRKVKAGQQLYSWDPHRVPILAEVSGLVRLVDVIEGETMRVEEERKGQKGRPVVIEHKGDKHPQVIIEDSEGKILDVHYLPAKVVLLAGTVWSTAGVVVRAMEAATGWQIIFYRSAALIPITRCE